MAHYALLNSQKKVTNVIVGVDEFTQDDNTIGSIDRTTHWENVYANMMGANSCKRTSYHTIAGTHREGGTPYRKNYAGIGYKYYVSHDGFAAPKPYPSWTLNTTTLLWDAPVDYPTDLEDDNGDPITYEWNETNQSWDIVT